jgi:hypothetical protein
VSVIWHAFIDNSPHSICVPINAVTHCKLPTTQPCQLIWVLYRAPTVNILTGKHITAKGDKTLYQFKDYTWLVSTQVSVREIQINCPPPPQTKVH